MRKCELQGRLRVAGRSYHVLRGVKSRLIARMMQGLTLSVTGVPLSPQLEVAKGRSPQKGVGGHLERCEGPGGPVPSL